jgi:hypothetical protein
MVSTCVKAFMAAGLQAELIKLLEMIVLQARLAALPVVTAYCLRESVPRRLRLGCKIAGR